MSSIMDELRRLQGKRRTPSAREPRAEAPPPLAPGPGPEPAPGSEPAHELRGLTLDEAARAAASGPSLLERLYDHRRLAGALLGVLVVLIVVVVAVPRGGRARGGTQYAATTTEQPTTANQSPSDTASTPEGAEIVDADVEAVDDTVEVADADVGTAATGVAEPDVAVAADEGDVADTPRDVEPDESLLALSLLLPYTEPTFTVLEPPAPKITPEEDTANKAAIRALEVRAVLGDEHGVVLYTSEGPLRAGSTYCGMLVKEITTRYAVFEYGPKRYKWPLPR